VKAPLRIQTAGCLWFQAAAILFVGIACGLGAAAIWLATENGGGSAGRSASSPFRCPVVDRSRPGKVAAAWVRSAVERHHVGCSYALTSRRPADALICFKDDLGKVGCYDRARWTTGDIPVVPYLSRREPTRRVLAMLIDKPKLLMARIVLSGQAGVATFLIALRKLSDGWVVAYWAPDAQPSVSQE